MVSHVRSFGLGGISGYEVSVECCISSGLPSFDIVGLPDASVKEARERVRAAIKTCGMNFPLGRITVNLAPADTRKAGTVYDLPVMLGILCASGDIDALPKNAAFFGELSLTGQLRHVSGALPMALCACQSGVSSLFVPADNAFEAAYASNTTVYPVTHVSDLLLHLRGGKTIAPVCGKKPAPEIDSLPDFSEVKGQENVKRALEVAAAGGHNILLVGPPGAGKSMLARRLPSILPDMNEEERIQATQIHSVAGLTSRDKPIMSVRPFRSPHHTVSAPAIAGGTSNPKPGEISLAHNGVLFLDELPEFQRDVLEALRQPLEDGRVTISRASCSVTYPSRFMLVCAMNPCKCGWHGHSSRRCSCSEGSVKKYHQRLSGPLLDRLDMYIEASSLSFEQLSKSHDAEASCHIKARVNAARSLQQKRYEGSGICSNAYIGAAQLQEHCVLSESCLDLMRTAYTRLSMTARSYDRVMRVARTIADLAASDSIEAPHLAEAIQYRRLSIGLDNNRGAQ